MINWHWMFTRMLPSSRTRQSAWQQRYWVNIWSFSSIFPRMQRMRRSWSRRRTMRRRRCSRWALTNWSCQFVLTTVSRGQVSIRSRSWRTAHRKIWWRCATWDESLWTRYWQNWKSWAYSWTRSRIDRGRGGLNR